MPKPRLPHTLLVFALALSAFVSLYRLGYKEFQGSEAWNLHMADRILTGHWPSIFYFNHAPLRVVLSVPVLAFGGESEFALRFTSALACIGVVPLLWILGRLLFPDTPIVAGLGGLFYAVTGSVVAARMAIGIGPFSFFALLAAIGLTLYLQQGRSRHLLLLALGLLLASFTYLDGMLLFPGVVLVFIATKGFQIDRRLLLTLAVCTAIILGYVFLWWYLPQRWEQGHVPQDLSITHLMSRATTGVAARPFVESWSVLRFYDGLIHTAVLLVGLALSFACLRRQTGLRLLLLFVASAVLFFSTHARPGIHIVKYLPFLALCAAVGWYSLARGRRGQILMIGILLAGALAGLGYTACTRLAPVYPDSPRPDYTIYHWGRMTRWGWRAAAAYVTAHGEETGSVVTDADPNVWERYTTIAWHGTKDEDFAGARFAVLTPKAARSFAQSLAAFTEVARVTVDGHVTLHIYDRQPAKPVQEPAIISG